MLGNFAANCRTPTFSSYPSCQHRSAVLQCTYLACCSITPAASQHIADIILQNWTLPPGQVCSCPHFLLLFTHDLGNDESLSCLLKTAASLAIAWSIEELLKLLVECWCELYGKWKFNRIGTAVMEDWCQPGAGVVALLCCWRHMQLMDGCCERCVYTSQGCNTGML